MVINYQLWQAAQIPTFKLRCADSQTYSSIFAVEAPGEAFGVRISIELADEHWMDS
jgi:hypothetical protein